jgi:hypothetical protein
LGATSVAMGAALAVVGVTLSADGRARALAAEAGRLEAAERLFTALETRRQRAQLGIISTLAENPNLTATLEAYDAESQVEGGLDADREALLRNAAASEARNMAQATGADAVAILDARGGVIASAGRAAVRWGSNHTLALSPTQPIVDGVVALPTGAFRISGAALHLSDAVAGTRTLGTLVLATSLDAEYARELTALTRAGVVIVSGKSVVGSTVPKEIETALLAQEGDPAGLRLLHGAEYVVRTMLASDHVSIHMLTPIDDAAEAMAGSGERALSAITIACFLIGFGAFVALVWTSAAVPTAPGIPAETGNNDSSLEFPSEAELAPVSADSPGTGSVPTDSPETGHEDTETRSL